MRCQEQQRLSFSGSMGPESNEKPIVIVHGANKHFGPRHATSIDLYTYDWVAHSRFRNRSIVVCRALDEPFRGVETAFYDGGKSRRSTFNAIRHSLAEIDPALIVVQQQARIASRLAQHFHYVPVLLTSHEFIPPPKIWFSRIKRVRRMRRLSGMIFVSEACRSSFLKDWPEFDAPTHAVPNGLDFAGWNPEIEREKTILFVGRMAPAKGVLELALALETVLPEFRDWKTCFICNRINKFPDYADQVRATLHNIHDQSQLMENQPNNVVKRCMERAAIVVVPSRWQEPFGRTALEAFAGGAALITTGTGGLAEIVGDDAIIEPDLSRQALGSALQKLIENDALRESLSRRGRKRGESLFDIRKVSRRLDDIYANHLESE